MIDEVTLRRLWPRAPQAIVDAIASRSAVVFPKYGLSTSLRQAHFMAQISHEFGGGTIGRENLNYSSAERVAEVWPRRFAPATAVPYVHNPEGLADKVYNDRMGNRPGSTDGYDYRGGGPLQLTGRDSYRDIGAIIGLPLEERPELVQTPTYMLEIAAAEFKKLGCLPFCDADNCEAVTRRVNGGYNGLASRQAWLVKWKAALRNYDPPLDHPGELDEPSPVQIPRGSDDRLPPAVEHPGKTMFGDGSTWAALVATFAGMASTVGSAVEALKPLITDPYTIGLVAVVIAGAGVFILYRNHSRLRSDHV